MCSRGLDFAVVVVRRALARRVTALLSIECSAFAFRVTRLLPVRLILIACAKGSRLELETAGCHLPACYPDRLPLPTICRDGASRGCGGILGLCSSFEDRRPWHQSSGPSISAPNVSLSTQGLGFGTTAARRTFISFLSSTYYACYFLIQLQVFDSRLSVRQVIRLEG
jgi:hypothetical protein